MASAAVPLIAGYLGSTLVSKIGESQGWDPRFTAIASIVAGAGAGSIGAGVGAASGGATMASANPHIGMGFKTVAPQVTGSMTSGTWGPSILSKGGTVPTVGGGPAYSGPIYASGQERFMAGMKDAWSDTWKDEKFITSLGTTFVDGMFAEPEKKQALSGGGGGGGGGSAPAYQGGQGGQYQLLVGFPQKATGPQWKEVA